MRAQEKTIKGFTIFEVLIVMVLIGIVSGLAYPNFSQWRKDRAVKNSAIKIRGLFLNTTAQVQRGLYAFAQVYVNTAPTKTVAVKTVPTTQQKVVEEDGIFKTITFSVSAGAPATKKVDAEIRY